MKPGFAALCLVLLLTGPLAAQSQRPDELKALQMEAVKALVAQDARSVQDLSGKIELILDQGVRAPGENGVSQYAFVAELLFRIGDTHGAARAYEKSINAARAEGLLTRPETHSVRYEFGNLLLLMGRDAEAYDVAQRLRDDLQQSGQLNSSIGLDALILIGSAQQVAGEHVAAARSFSDAVEQAQTQADAGQKLRLALTGLSGALMELGAFDAALEPSRRVVELDEQMGAADNEAGLYARLQYGLALESAGQLDGSREVTQAVLGDAVRQLPEDHAVTRFARQTLARLDRAQGHQLATGSGPQNHTTGAEGGDDPSVKLNALLDLAAHDLANDAFERYETSLLAALELISTHPDAATPVQYARINFALADVLASQRLMFPEAKVFYDRSIRILTAEFGPDHRETLQAKARKIRAKDLEIQANVSLQRPKSELAFWDGTEEGKKPTSEELDVLRRLAIEEGRHGSRFEAYAAHLRYAFHLSEADQFDHALSVINAQMAARRAEKHAGALPDPEIDFRLADAQGTTLLKAGRFASAAAAFRDGTEPLLFHLRSTQWSEREDSTAEQHVQGQAYGELYASAALRAAEQGAPAKQAHHTQVAFEAMQLAGYGPASLAVARAVTREANRDPDRLPASLPAEFARVLERQIPAPLGLREVQRNLLGPDEALVAILTSTIQSVSPDGVKGLVLAVTRDDAVMVEIPLPWAQLVRDINSLHDSLDPKTPERLAALRAPLASVQGSGNPDRMSAPFAFKAASRLHDAFFGLPEIDNLIGNKSTWTLVPFGETLGIPFAALIVEDRNALVLPTQRTADDLRSIRWLGHERALHVVPSVQALKTLRDRAPSPDADSQLAYVGIGAPAFSGDELAGLPSADTIMRRSISERSVAVSALPPLPGTRREIETLARVFGADQSEIRLGRDATEAQLGTLSSSGVLAQADVLHFATHGLLSGAFDGLSEPALALTPGNTGQSGADGLLTASEAAQLQLDADWVILSACDTAGEDSLGGEGLGGLVQGFFAAGARNVLASHWRVNDLAAERLITRTVILSRDGTAKAEALRRAMRELAADETRDQTLLPNAHPSVWAPFLMIGGG